MNHSNTNDLSDTRDINNTDDYTDNINEAIHTTAQLLYSAEVLLVVTGAGFSADSGLATYLDVADIDAYRRRGWKYRDLCRPFVMCERGDIKHEDADNNVQHHQVDRSSYVTEHVESEDSYQPLLFEDDEMRHPKYFYGFWGQCINDYRKVRPHEGYDIIARWGHDKNNAMNTNRRQSDVKLSKVAQQIQNITRKLEGDNYKSFGNAQEPYYVSPNERAGAFFFFTSNVDAHSYDVFESHEIRECHGNTEIWQCKNFECGTNDSCRLEDDTSEDEIGECDDEKKDDEKTWERRLWRLPLDHVFEVNFETMSAPSKKYMNVSKQTAHEPQTKMAQSLNHLPLDGLSRKRKSESNLNQQEEDADDILNYLQNQFATANDLNNNLNSAHIGDVHGKPRVSPLKSMMHPATLEEPNHYLKISSNDNWPKCPRCHELARPAVLMFDDLDWVYNLKQERRWQRWCRAVLKLCKVRISCDDDDDSHVSDYTSVNESDLSNEGWEHISDSESSECKPLPSEEELVQSESMIWPTEKHQQSSTQQQPLKVLILEIGCGYNVPTCRMISETWVKHLLQRGGNPTLVRINPTHSEVDDDNIGDCFIGIKDKGLRVLKYIDMSYQQLQLDNAANDGR